MATPALTAESILAQAGITPVSTASVLAAARAPAEGDLAAAAPAPALSGKVARVVSPTGEGGTVPVEHLQQALAQGYEEDTPAKAAVRAYLAENRGLSGTAKVALGQFANQALLGIPEIVAERTGDPLESAKWEALKKDHAIANVAGGAAGFGASLAVGGPLFKGATLAGQAAERALLRGGAEALATKAAAAGLSEGVAQSIARRTVASAARMGTEGAVVAAPVAVTEAALGDPERAGETLLYAIGGGAALGAMAPGAKALFARATKGMVLAPGSTGGKLEAFANEQAVKSLSPYKRISDRLAEVPGGEQTAGRVIRDKGLFRNVGESFDDLTTRIQDARRATGAGIDELYGRLDSKGVAIGPNVLADDLRREVLDPLAKQVGFGARAKKVAAYIDDLEAKRAAQPMKPSELVGIRRDLDTLIYGERLPSPEQVDQQLKAIRNVYKKTLDGAVREHLGEGALTELEKLNTEYRVLSIIEKGAKANIGRDMTNRTTGLTDYLLGLSAADVGKAAGGMVGGPLGTVIGGGASQLVGMLGNKYLRQNFNTLAMKGAEKLGLLFTEQAMRKSALELDRVPAVLVAMARAPVAAAARSEAMATWAGDGANRAAHYTALADRLGETRANLEATIGRVAEVSGALAETGAPKSAQAYQAAQLRLLEHIYATMPKAPAPGLFAGKPTWKPTERDLAAWERRVEVAHDPFRVLAHLEAGTLTREHIDTLRTLYPKLHQDMVARVVAAAASPDAPKLSAAARARLHMLMGDGEPAKAQSVRSAQAVFAMAPPTDQAPRGAPQGPDMASPMQKLGQ